MGLVFGNEHKKRGCLHISRNNWVVYIYENYCIDLKCVLIWSSIYVLILIVTKESQVNASQFCSRLTEFSRRRLLGRCLARPCPACSLLLLLSRVTPGRWPPPTTRLNTTNCTNLQSVFLPIRNCICPNCNRYILCSLLLSRDTSRVGDLRHQELT